MLASLVACQGSTVSVPETVSLEGEQTWYGVIGPLVTSRCAVCHHPGDIAPFSLENIDEVKVQLSAMRAAVADGIMPPFPPDQSEASGCPKIDDVRQMSDAERAALLAWIDAGAPEGTPRTLPPVKPNKPLGDPAYRWPMSEPYTPTVAAGDEYRCFLVRTNNVVDLPVAAVSAEPGQRSIVHHAAVFLIPPDQIQTANDLDNASPGPGYDCFGGIGFAQAYPAGVWVPGNDAPLVPPSSNVGYYLPPGWAWVLQVHYNVTGHPPPDTTSVVLWLGDPIITEVPHAIIAGNVDFALPPSSQMTVVGEAAVTDTSTPETFNSGWAGRVYAVWGHEHLLGKSVQLDVVKADGSEQCLLHIPRWDFHWQSVYRLKNFVSVSPGDHIRVRCSYENTTDRMVTYGEGTADEMCFASVAALDP
nr:hypothetical protein Hi04_10k_c3807_00022 [uncultured bacterium]